MADTPKPEIVQLLRRINEGATDSQTSLGDVMRLCFRLGSLLKNRELSDWAKAEAGGYISADSLPSYRVFGTEVLGTFSGPFGSGIKNAPIPQLHIEQEHRDALCKAYLTQPVGELEQLAHRGRTHTNGLTIAWPGDVIWYYQQKPIYQNLVLTAAEQILTTTSIVGILEVIRARVLEFVLAIEKELGVDIMSDDDKKPLQTLSQERINQVFNTTIHEGTSIAIGNTGTTNQYATHVQPGDLQGLKDKLTQLGVTAELITDLDAALDKDADSGEQPGPHVQGWFGRLMIKAGQGTLLLASTAATTVVVAEVRRFLGLPPA